MLGCQWLPGSKVDAVECSSTKRYIHPNTGKQVSLLLLVVGWGSQSWGRSIVVFEPRDSAVKFSIISKASCCSFTLRELYFLGFNLNRSTNRNT